MSFFFFFFFLGGGGGGGGEVGGGQNLLFYFRILVKHTVNFCLIPESAVYLGRVSITCSFSALYFQFIVGNSDVILVT